MSEVQTFIAALVALATIPSAVLAAAAYVIRQMIGHATARDIEQFKQGLKITEFEHQTQFANVYQRRAEVIAELFKRLAATQRLAELFVEPLQTNREVAAEYRRQIAESYNAAAEYFALHRLYLSAASAEKCDRLLKAIREAVFARDEGSVIEGSNVKALLRAWEKIQKDIPPLQEDLAREFRAMLGVPQ